MYFVRFVVILSDRISNSLIQNLDRLSAFFIKHLLEILFVKIDNLAR
jgi:hypothetical protein